jgi:dTDP-4-dehydrorhamnose reductase
MKVFIIGASGLVGSNCLTHFIERGWTVKGSHCNYPTDTTYYYDTLQPQNIQNFDIVSFGPDIMVHCAALTNVDYCETHEEESYEQTVKSTQHVCELATLCNARVVYISTDYVFDGNAGPYNEGDTPNPINVYGKHKLLAEQLVLSSIIDSLVLRVTNVYGGEARGKNFIARIVQQCQQEAQLFCLKLPYDQFATPINAQDITRAMFYLINDKKTGIYHLASTDYMNRVELAKRTVSYFPHAQCSNIESIDSITLNQNAKRPLVGGLLKIKFTTEYPTFVFTNVDNYLHSIAKTHISA